MKKQNIIMQVTLLVISMAMVRAQHPAPFDAEHWEIKDASSQTKGLTDTILYGRSCLRLPAGHVAYLKDSSYKNFRMEMDLAGIAMPGFGFRGQDMENYEYLYLRVLCDNQGDALQYLPVFNGGFSWQLYNYPEYEHKVSFPKRFLASVQGGINAELPAEEVHEQVKVQVNSGGVSLSDAVVVMQTGPALWKIIDPENLTLHYLEQEEDSARIYSGLEWIHVKLEVFGKQAKLFVEDMDTPVMVIHGLKQEEAPGLITFRNVWVDSYYANFSIERIKDLPVYREPEAEDPPAGYLSEWAVSGKFLRNDQNLQAQIDSVKSHTEHWSPVRADSDGLINMSRFFEVTEGTAILRTYIESPEDLEVDLLFDYSEHLAISLNSEIIFSESLRVNKNEGRVMDGEEKIPLKIQKGRNELLFVLTSDNYRQNWGMIARIAQPSLSDNTSF